jgi:hypothetical protein
MPVVVEATTVPESFTRLTVKPDKGGSLGARTPPPSASRNTVPEISSLKKKTLLCRFVMAVVFSMTLASVSPCLMRLSSGKLKLSLR